MALATWIGTTSTAFATDTNWSPVAVPADGDTLLFGDQATQGMAGGAVAAKGFDIIFDRGFVYGVGSSGSQFAPANTCPTVTYRAEGIIPTYIDATITRCLLATTSAKDDVLNIDGTTTELAIESGKFSLDAGGTVNGRISVGTGGELTVPSGATLTDVEIQIDGGKMTTSASATTVTVESGEFILDGTAGVTGVLQMWGGDTWWDAASTIALAQIYGGEFKTRKERASRVLTNANMHGLGKIDFRIGGSTITYSNAIRAYGEYQPMFPKGTGITPSL
jgi:hypothetical protein